MVELNESGVVSLESALAEIDAAPDRQQLSNDLARSSLELQMALNHAARRFEADHAVGEVTDELAMKLLGLRQSHDAGAWSALAQMAQRHPVSAYFLQDPFTGHSFRKPRGYAGDAELLDHIYFHNNVRPAVEAATPFGARLHAHSIQGAACVAVRERRDLLAADVDAVAVRTNGAAEILSIAAGHLREAELSSALRNGAIKRWVALDQDPMSIGLIARDHRGTAIEAIDGSVKGILTGKHELGLFDYVYAAGLYDYLPRAIAIKLTRRAMAMLKPGGAFLFANFSDEVWNAGYMETFMDWTLLQRTEADMWDIAKASVDRNQVDIDVFFGENRNIIYARLTRKD